jgi:hypothetical protein
VDGTRRRLLAAGGAAGLVMLTRTALTAGSAPALDPIPPLPTTPTPGKPGDFDFLSGEWRIRNWRPKPTGEWLEFAGEATVHGILSGVGSVEELRIPEKNFSGMGLRLLDREKKVWSDHWVNAESGVVSVPGMPGSFENGAGIFIADDTEDGKPVKYASIWDQIAPRSCRWRQAASKDGGKTWEQNWIMHWQRA